MNFSKFVFGIMTLSVMSCQRQQEDPTVQLASVIGENTQYEVQASDLPAWLNPMMLAAVGLTNNHCSAFHIGAGLVLTAGHCVSKPKTDQNTVPCENMWIRWDYRRGQGGVTDISRCIELVDYEYSSAADFALMRVDPAPEAHLPFGVQNDYFRGGNYAVLGYPQGEYLHWSQGCRIEPGEVHGWGEYQVAHDCDTRPGNSGSPLINLETQQVEGIHAGGDKDSNYATMLDRVPLSQILVAQPPNYFVLKEDEKQFGPFRNNEREILVVFPKAIGDQVSFVIDADVEKGYDHVFVVDGSGKRRKLTGKFHTQFAGLNTPVMIIFASDYAGQSRFIRIKLGEH